MNEMSTCIKRTWVRQQISNESDLTVDSWDSGSHKYERWPDGDVCWKVISRELTPTGFSEVLQRMPEWFAPGEVLHWAQVPLLLQGPSQYQLGQWSVAVENQVKLLPLHSEKMAAKEGMLQEPRGHMRREGHPRVKAQVQPKINQLKRLGEKRAEQRMKLQMTPQGHLHKPPQRLINQK